jgi:hypothetical protein
MAKNTKVEQPKIDPDVKGDIIRAMVEYACGRDVDPPQLKVAAERLGPFMQPIIQATIDSTLQAKRLDAEKTMKDTYKATERRLYALPILKEKVEYDRGRIDSLDEHDLPDKSKSIVRFQKSGVRLAPDEIIEAVKQNLAADIAADLTEIDKMEKALEVIQNDSYYLAVKGKYLLGLSDDQIAECIPCDPSTVRRNRGRLIRKVAIWLYGTLAI